MNTNSYRKKFKWNYFYHNHSKVPEGVTLRVKLISLTLMTSIPPLIFSKIRNVQYTHLNSETLTDPVVVVPISAASVTLALRLQLIQISIIKIYFMFFPYSVY